jgi:hypothetical protein
MALYAALTFWLVIIMFSAWGVHRLWSTLIKPRVVNVALLPGTLVAQLGHVLGMLLSGNSVRNTALMGDDEEGEPTSETPEKQRIPIIGPILVGLLPLVACAAGLYVSALFFGDSVIGRMATRNGPQLPQELPLSLGGIFDLLRGCLTLIEDMLIAILRSDLPNWPTVLFLYLSVCMTVRMAPFEGNRRGAIGAIFLAAVVISILASLVPNVRQFIIHASWPLLSFAVAMLLFLLLVSLLVHGIVGLVRVLATKE